MIHALAPHRWQRRREGLIVAFAAGISSSLSSGDARIQSALNPEGPVSRYINTWWWVLFAVASFVVVLVTVLVLVALFRRRRGKADDPDLSSGRERNLL